MAASTSSSNSAGQQEMDRDLLKAATSGDAAAMKNLHSGNRNILLGKTPMGNTCLHISSIHGHWGFCKDVMALEPSLLGVANSDEETPLLTAARSGHASLASLLLGSSAPKAILRRDASGCNALHHAIRNGDENLASELIAAAPALSKGVNNHNESPMFIAVMRDFADVFRKLLEIPGSADVGVSGSHALHAAVRNGNPGIVEELVKKRPWLASQGGPETYTPVFLAVFMCKTDVLRALLQHSDWSLGYSVSHRGDGAPLLLCAAFRGHVGVAQALLEHCPDAPYCDDSGWTCLHEAVKRGHASFVDFVLGSPYLRRLVNMRDSDGKTALHYAVQRCDTKIVGALLRHRGTDLTILDNDAMDPAWELGSVTDYAKTLNWNEVSMLLLEADPRNASSVYNLHNKVRGILIDSSRKDAKSLTQTYTSNTSLVAILIATITFAAAFTLPGGYSNDAGNEGLPIMARKFAFQAFLISDTLAMCSSLAVAFICIVTRWEDLQFLLHYRSITKKLMWFAYMATSVAFATSLYTILAPQLLWLAIGICSLSVLLPIITYLLGKWPILKLRYRLGKTFNSDLLDMV